MALPTMQKGNLDSGAEVDVHGRIRKQTMTLDAVSVTFGVGARWSEDLKDHAGTQSCELPHVAPVESGRLGVGMDDGSEETFSRMAVMMLPPGHDAWTVGDEPGVFVEYSKGNDYYEDH